MEKKKLKILTYNLRCNSASDGVNMFDIRKGLILDKLTREAPDIIGFQEMLPAMRAFLKRHLTGYTIVGRSRSADYGGEHVDIAFNTETTDVFALEYFWLSPSPYAAGSRYENQSSCPRITTAGVFKHRGFAEPFRVYNTHLDHVGEEARVKGMKLILDKIAEDGGRFKLPVLLMGDMNAEPGSEAVKLALQAPLTDLTAGVKSSFHGWGSLENVKIDYIFADAAVTDKFSAEVSVWDDCVSGVYLSDHYPVMVTLEEKE